MTEEDSYIRHVQAQESTYAEYAKKSFESVSTKLVNGEDIVTHYDAIWRSDRARLVNRTPLQRERDGILYSDSMRRMTEKYHVLYCGQERIVRNYTTHTLRMTQVSRSIARALNLNMDFVEAIALGSKVGAAPFIHASKSALGDFIVATLSELDGAAGGASQQFPLVTEDKMPLPNWLANLRSTAIQEAAKRYMPWSAGNVTDGAYSSGREGYWLLLTNPFTRISASATYLPETIYGIWQHSRNCLHGRASFSHRVQLGDVVHSISGEHVTYEGIVSQYADDITWAIENLSDAHRAALLAGRRGLFDELESELRHKLGLSSQVQVVANALRDQDTGSLYTFFIYDFVSFSQKVLHKVQQDGVGRRGIVEGKVEYVIGLSSEGNNILNCIISFLKEVVFSEPRVENRRKLLQTLTSSCVKLLYAGGKDALLKKIDEKSSAGKWPREITQKSQDLLANDVHRMQLAVDIFCEMSDQEIFDFVGIHSL